MKTILVSLLAFISFSNVAIAGQTYTCKGKVGKKPAQINISFKNYKEVIVSTPDDNQFNLPLVGKNSQYRTFADYEYDGYGGSVELKVPMEVSYQFNVQFKVETYSEVGHVSSETFVGSCK